MIKSILFLFLLVFSLLPSSAQDSVKHRLILIGDAGEMNSSQLASLENASKHILATNTSVIFLGDNIYPTGMGLPGSPEELMTQQILRSQYTPMRTAGASVYFIPGNHDWDRSGPQGLRKIRLQDSFLNAQNDSKLRLIPHNGCPDPVAIELTDKLVVIAYDTEWWLFPHDKTSDNLDCDCKTKEEVLNKMKKLLAQNTGKMILLASHHPFDSYGPHGGRFTLKDHLFPLTALKHYLYIPLPILGSAYPLLRKAFTNPEDIGHPKYKEMISKISDVFSTYPNVAYVAGHDHGLQLIKNERLQVVSGSGAKVTSVNKSNDLLFHENKQGYVIVDQLSNNDLKYTYYVYSDNGTTEVYSYTQPYQTMP